MLSNTKTLEDWLNEMGYEKQETPNYESEKKKLLGLLGDVSELLELTGAFLAGGAITSLFTNKEINDFDIYFPSSESFSRFLAGILSTEWGYFSIVHQTNRSVLMTNHGGAKLQLIVYKFFPTVQDIFNDFDFTVNMGAYDFKNEKFVLNSNFLKHNSQRYLDINTNTAYPLISMLRVDKYREKGYKVSKAQVLKLLFKITDLQIDNWDEALDHVGGMYGVDPEKIFDRTKEFSIDEAINQLGSLSKIDNNWTPKHPTIGELADNLEDKLLPSVFKSMKSNRWDVDYLQYVPESPTPSTSEVSSEEF